MLIEFIEYTNLIRPGFKDSHINKPTKIKEYFKQQISRKKELIKIYNKLNIGEELTEIEENILSDFNNNIPSNVDSLVEARYTEAPANSQIIKPSIQEQQRIAVEVKYDMLAIKDSAEIIRGQKYKLYNSKGFIGEGIVVNFKRQYALLRAVTDFNIRDAIYAEHYKWWRADIEIYKWVKPEVLIEDKECPAVVRIEFVVPYTHIAGYVKWSLYYQEEAILIGNDYNSYAEVIVESPFNAIFPKGNYQVKAKRLDPTSGRVLSHANTQIDIKSNRKELQFLTSGRIDYKASLVLT
jgi:hypothetical protein